MHVAELPIRLTWQRVTSDPNNFLRLKFIHHENDIVSIKLRLKVILLEKNTKYHFILNFYNESLKSKFIYVKI